MENPDEFCSKIKLEDGRDLYFSIKEAGDGGGNKNSWSLILTDGSRIWNTEVSEDDLADMAVGSSYSAEQFVSLFKTAFNLLPREPGTSLKYMLKGLSAGTDCFFWSIFLPKDNKTFRLGSLNISPLPEEQRAPVYSRMFDSLLSVSNQCRAQAESSRAQSEEEKIVSKAALMKLEKSVIVQEECERVLYTNFVAVLNEKKRKIRELQDQCDAYKQTFNQDTNSSVQETIPEEEATTSKRGNTTKAAVKRSYKPISACKAPAKKQQNRRGKQKNAVEFDSADSETEEDEQLTLSDVVPSAASTKRSRLLVKSSDEESTEIDEPMSEGETRSKSLPVKPTMEETVISHPPLSITERHTDSPPEVKPHASIPDEKLLSRNPTTVSFLADTKAKKIPPAASNKRPGEDELDDLLGEVKPASSTAKKQPIKRVNRNASKIVPAPTPTRTRPPRRAAAGQNMDSDNLLDGLLDGL